MDIVKVCRLCLNIIYDDDFDPVESDISQMLEKLLLKVNLGISGDPIICNECAASLQDFFDFKCKCLGTENVILLFRDAKETSTVDLREVYLNENKDVDTNDISEQKICRFCLNNTKYEFTQLHDTKENIFIVSLLLKHVPELNLNITDELISRKTCFETLQSFHYFVSKCIDVEEKVSKYTAVEGTDDNGHIELRNIANYTHEGALRKKEIYECRKDDSMCMQIKTENLLGEDNIDMGIEPEEVNLKTDLSDSDSQDAASTDQHDIPMYECRECSFKSKYRQSLANHRRNHQSPLDVAVYECDLCPYKTKFKGRLKRHSLIHKDPSELNMFSCEQCTFSTRLLANLLRHQIVHKDPSEVTKYKCKMCSYETKFKYDLKTHAINQHNPKTNKYKCDVCSYAANLKRYLDKHKLVHKSPSEVTMYKCTECAFATKYKDGLQRHSIIHKSPDEVSMFKCELCSYKGTKLGNLNRHMIIHKSLSEVTLLECDKCSYKTKHKHDLTKHKKVHPDPSESTVYKCDKCAYVTRYQRSLKRHISTNCGVKIKQ